MKTIGTVATQNSVATSCVYRKTVKRMQKPSDLRRGKNGCKRNPLQFKGFTSLAGACQRRWTLFNYSDPPQVIKYTSNKLAKVLTSFFFLFFWCTYYISFQKYLRHANEQKPAVFDWVFECLAYVHFRRERSMQTWEQSQHLQNSWEKLQCLLLWKHWLWCIYNYTSNQQKIEVCRMATCT